MKHNRGIRMASLVVIDGDLISYKCAAANESRTVEVIHKSSGRSAEFDNRTSFRTWLKKEDKWEESEFDIHDIQSPQPLQNALHSAKMMVKRIKSASGCDDFKVVVQGKGNFRDDLLLPVKYKSTRQDLLRPIHLRDVRQYLINKYKAELANGRESDDVLSSYAYEGWKTKTKIVQATVDKDAKQCSGWLYNWDKHDKPIFIHGIGDLSINSKGKMEGYGRKWLYAQWSVGDPSDSYKPTHLTSAKYGEKGAVADFGSLQSDKECFQKLIELYKRWYPEPFEYVAWDGATVKADYLHMMQLYVDCAHMQRWEGDRINVKEVFDRYGLL